MSTETELICRAFITLKNGKRLYARQYGLKAFCFEVSPKEPLEDPEEDQKTEKTDSTEEAV